MYPYHNQANPMRSVLLLYLFCVVTFVNCQAQKYSYGLKTGAGMSNINRSLFNLSPSWLYSCERNEVSYPVFSATAGLVVDIRLHRHFSIQPALQYSLIGSEIHQKTITSLTPYSQLILGINDEYRETNSKKTIQLHYLQIPIMCQFILPLGGKKSIGLGIGPYFALTIAGTIKVDAHHRRTFVDSQTHDVLAEYESPYVYYKSSMPIKSSYSQELLTTDNHGNIEQEYVRPYDYGLTFSPFFKLDTGERLAIQLAPYFSLGLANIAAKPKETSIWIMNSMPQTARTYSYGLNIAILISKQSN
jgi:hypothetical protein